MINVSIYNNAEGICRGFKVLGHAGYADSGSDIICAAVSVLVINTVNSIEEFTSDRFDFGSDEETGLIEFILLSETSNEAILLLNSLILGLQGIQKDYGNKYIKLVFKEV